MECARRRAAARVARVSHGAACHRMRLDGDGLAAALSHRMARRFARRCDAASTRRRTPTASTCSTGPGRTLFAAMAIATIPSWSARFRSRRRPARGCFARSDDVRAALLAQALTRIEPASAGGPPRFSSLHVLFPDAADAALCRRAGMTMRSGVQFRWSNPGYRDFADFLATFNHDKRKKVQQERRKVAAADVHFVRARGTRHHPRGLDLLPSLLRRHLSRASFDALSLARILPAHRRNHAGQLCCSRSAPGAENGCAPRSTSSTRPRCGGATGVRCNTFPGCTSRRATTRRSNSASSAASRSFEGGAQGVHKLARGLLPVATHSAHAIADPDFAQAIADFCRREQVEIAHMQDELAASSPFRG